MKWRMLNGIQLCKSVLRTIRSKYGTEFWWSSWPFSWNLVVHIFIGDSCNTPCTDRVWHPYQSFFKTLFKNLYSQEKIIDFHFLNFSQEKESVSQCIRDLKAMAPAWKECGSLPDLTNIGPTFCEYKFLLFWL